MKPLVERFLDKILIGDECWEWTATRDHGGYGRIRHEGRLLNAHRVAYEWAKGPISAGLEIDHLCRNRGCVKPSHLEAVTRAENVKRGRAGSLQPRKTHCIHGHELTGGNLRLYKDRRYCLQCKRNAKLKYRAKLRSATV